MAGVHADPHPAQAPADFSRAFAIGIALNLGFVVVQAYFGWVSGSLALLADAAHNLGDVAALVLAAVAALAARRPGSLRRTWGWQRATLLAAFANAVALLVAMGVLGWEALQRLAAPQPVAASTVIVVAAIGIVVNGATALLFLRGRQRDLNVRAAFVHMVGDALVSLGVVVAGVLTLLYGWAWVDPVAGLLISAVIVVGSWGLLRQATHLLFDGVPQGIDLREVERELAALPGVGEVSDLHVWAAGTTHTVLSAHLVVPDGAPGDDFYRDAAARLHARFDIDHVTLQVTRSTVPFACRAPLRR